jgi:hypothetical protein
MNSDEFVKDIFAYSQVERAAKIIISPQGAAQIMKIDLMFLLQREGITKLTIILYKQTKAIFKILLYSVYD